MNKLKLLPPTDPQLNKISRKVEVDEFGGRYIEEVIEAMTRIALSECDEKHSEKRSLVGLAAPQIGAPVRIILFDKSADAGKPNFSPEFQIVINPEIMSVSDEEELGREGCYSTGEICAAICRAKSIELNGMDRMGNQVNLEIHDFQARIVQHEIDHLNGVRCPDRIRSLKHLHKVGSDDFQAYRENWLHWTNLCPIDDWLKMKNGR